MQEIDFQVEAAWQDFERLEDKIEAEILAATAEADPAQHPAILHDMGVTTLKYLYHRFPGDGEWRGYLHTRRTLLLKKIQSLLLGRNEYEYPEYTDRIIIAKGGLEAEYIVGTIAENGVPIAIKLLKYTAKKSVIEQFRNEQAALRALSIHYQENYPPNLIKLYASEDEITVTERIIGAKNLDSVIKTIEPGVDPNKEFVKRLGYFRDIVAGLTAFYEAGYEQHGDVKFPNCILGSDDVVRVCDFSAAEKEESIYGLSVMGTAMYMATEKAIFFPLNNSFAPIDRRADVFSLGIMLHELLTLGKDPFNRHTMSIQEKSDSTLVIAAAFADFIRLNKLRFENKKGIEYSEEQLKELNEKYGRKKLSLHGCPFIQDEKMLEKLDAVISKAIAPIPTDRYASPAEFLAAIENALEMKL